MQKGRIDELIEQYSELDPVRPSKAEARLKGYNVKDFAAEAACWLEVAGHAQAGRVGQAGYRSHALRSVGR